MLGKAREVVFRAGVREKEQEVTGKISCSIWDLAMLNQSLSNLAVCTQAGTYQKTVYNIICIPKIKVTSFGLLTIT